MWFVIIECDSFQINLISDQPVYRDWIQWLSLYDEQTSFVFVKTKLSMSISILKPFSNFYSTLTFSWSLTTSWQRRWCCQSLSCDCFRRISKWFVDMKQNPPFKQGFSTFLFSVPLSVFFYLTYHTTWHLKANGKTFIVHASFHNLVNHLERSRVPQIENRWNRKIAFAHSQKISSKCEIKYPEGNPIKFCLIGD